jgi:hypothetical protein
MNDFNSSFIIILFNLFVDWLVFSTIIFSPNLSSIKLTNLSISLMSNSYVHFLLDLKDFCEIRVGSISGIFFKVSCFSFTNLKKQFLNPIPSVSSKCKLFTKFVSIVLYKN